MQRLEVSGAVRPLYGSLGVKGLINVLILGPNASVMDIKFTRMFLLDRKLKNFVTFISGKRSTSHSRRSYQPLCFVY